MKLHTLQILFAIFLGLAMTCGLALVPRLGTEYYCTTDPRQILPHNRDVRGIPLVFGLRSIQSTGCSPAYYGTGVSMTLEESDSSLNFVALVADVVFWTIMAYAAVSLPHLIEAQLRIKRATKATKESL